MPGSQLGGPARPPKPARPAAGSRPARTACTALAILAVAASLAACRPTGSPGDGSGGQPTAGTFVVAFVGDLTGPGRDEGASVRNAAQLAVEEAAAGAPPGLTVVLKDLDTGGNPAQAADQAASAAGDPAVLGMVATPGAAPAVAPVAARSGLPVVSPSAPEAGGGAPLRFVGPSREAAARALATHVAGTLEAARVALFHAGPGSPQAGSIRAALVAAGVEVALDAAVDPAADAHPDAVAAARALAPAPQALVYAGPADTGGRLARQLTAAGLRARMVADASLVAPAFVEAAGRSAAAGTHALCACTAPGESDEAPAGFAASYAARFGGPPGRLAAEAYAVTRMLAAGIAAGQTRRADLAAHVAGQDSVEVGGRRMRLDGGELTLYEVRDGRFTAVGAVSAGG